MDVDKPLFDNRKDDKSYQGDRHQQNPSQRQGYSTITKKDDGKPLDSSQKASQNVNGMRKTQGGSSQMSG